ncbi:hypothetical protein F5I97DRAFT_1809283 [Phlebopus sp. FC_14]|nr:hypothetical protein F5I97DRAFT_1809283 [Phlebopus sp. FC_14]
MARATDAVTSESDSEQHRSGSTKKKYSSKKARRASSDVEEEKAEQPADSGEEEADENEEEYEIEEIIDAKKGQFPHGRFGYFVKWKGYGPEHNSWVDEDDAGNAQELIDQFWSKRKKQKPGPRKSEPTKTKTKRETDQDEIEEADEDEARAKKKPRKSNGVRRKAKEESDEDEEDKCGDMSKHMSIPSWENLIETVDTVERDDKGDLLVYFKLKNDKVRRRENSRVCSEKFPQKLILFYESNLRWKTDGEPADE